MKETAVSLLALLALVLLQVVLADERSLPFQMPMNETSGLEVFEGDASAPKYRCGKEFDGAKCVNIGDCCSRWGWCGKTAAYCAPENCQSQCPPPPPPPPSPPPPPPPNYRCGKDFDDAKCVRIGDCCSRWGWCGSTPAYCDPENCQSQCKDTLTSSVKNRMRGIESFQLNAFPIN